MPRVRIRNKTNLVLEPVLHAPHSLSVVRSIRIPFIITLPLPFDTKFMINSFFQLQFENHDYFSKRTNYKARYFEACKRRI
jgi:hypothetical protein